MRRFGAIALMTIGVLMAALCGACTFQVIHDTLLGWRACPNLPRGEECGPAMLATSTGWSIAFVLVIGGAPTLFGLVLLRAGWKAWPRNRSTRSPD